MKLRRFRDFPKEIWIGENLWQIKFMRILPGASEAWEVAGLCDPACYTIFIRKGLSPPERLITFFHEVAHAFESELGRNFNHKLVERIARLCADVVMQNLWGDEAA